PAADRPGPGGRTTVNGAWSLNVKFGPDEKAATLTLQQEGERLTGSIAGSLGAGEISNASMTADEVRFTVPLQLEGQTKEVTFTGTLSGNEIRGTVNVVGQAPGSFTATRARPN